MTSGNNILKRSFWIMLPVNQSGHQKPITKQNAVTFASQERVPSFKTTYSPREKPKIVSVFTSRALCNLNKDRSIRLQTKSRQLRNIVKNKFSLKETMLKLLATMPISKGKKTPEQRVGNKLKILRCSE